MTAIGTPKLFGKAEVGEILRALNAVNSDEKRFMVFVMLARKLMSVHGANQLVVDHTVHGEYEVRVDDRLICRVGSYETGGHA